LHGISATLHIGIPKQPVPDFVAHAWVECDGMVVNDKADIREDYAELTHVSQATLMAQGRHNFR
jgi:hypothetical protein